jgi:hypothetical protein
MLCMPNCKRGKRKDTKGQQHVILLTCQQCRAVIFSKQQLSWLSTPSMTKWAKRNTHTRHGNHVTVDSLLGFSHSRGCALRGASSLSPRTVLGTAGPLTVPAHANCMPITHGKHSNKHRHSTIHTQTSIASRVMWPGT